MAAPGLDALAERGGPAELTNDIALFNTAIYVPRISCHGVNAGGRGSGTWSRSVSTYLELIRFFADKDPTTRVMIESILADEEDHASDMHDLLVAHEGRPSLQG